jgi:hypothetical protein
VSAATLRFCGQHPPKGGLLQAVATFSENFAVQFPDRRVVPCCYRERFLLFVEAAPKDPGAATNHRLAGVTSGISSAALSGLGAVGGGLSAGEKVHN